MKNIAKKLTSKWAWFTGAQLTRGIGAPLTFFENWKKVLILEKNALIAFTFGLNFLSELLFDKGI